MTDQLLDILKYALLALLYLFFARVLWAVWSEVRGPRAGHLMAAPTQLDPADPTLPAPVPAPPSRAKRAPRGVVTKLTVLQPRERKGATFNVSGEITIGRAATCTVVIVDDSFVSTMHARVFQADGATWVDDLGSTNGSHLNGVRFTTVQRLSRGDRLQIGSTLFEAS